VPAPPLPPVLGIDHNVRSLDAAPKLAFTALLPEPVKVLNVDELPDEVGNDIVIPAELTAALSLDAVPLALAKAPLAVIEIVPFRVKFPLTKINNPLQGWSVVNVTPEFIVKS
jgi:hypothetical protein